MLSKTTKGYLFAVLSAVIYGCMPLMAKHIYADGTTPMTLVFLRNFIALPILAVLAYKEKKTLKIPLKLLPSISVISLLGCCITPILLFSSYQFIASGTATVFHFIYPAVVVIVEILFLKSKVQAGNIISVLLCVTGISLFYSPEQSLNFAGSSLALLSGFTFATYVIMLSRFDNRNVSGFLLCFYVALVSSIVTLIVCIATNNLVLPSSMLGWGLCALFSLLITVGAVSLFQQSAFLIGSERTSILSTLEPITGVILGVIAFDEPLGAKALIGSVLVVTASILIAVFDATKKKQETKHSSAV